MLPGFSLNARHTVVYMKPLDEISVSGEVRLFKKK